MLSHENEFPSGKMCKVLGVSSSSYYHWKRSPKSLREQKKQELKQVVKDVYFEFKQRYGSPRISAELKARGYKISEPTVAKYMKELGLRSKLAKKFKVTTDSKHNYLVVENILERRFKQTAPCKAWVSDITYIPVKEGFVYLTTVIDLYDRKLIGWSISKSMNTEDTTLAAFKMARKNRPFKAGLIFHSDQGVQYANKKFTNVLEAFKVTRSMSRKGNCWDNAVAESFFKSLKTEIIYGNLLVNRQKMEKNLFEYIELWYNKKRRHSHLGYLTIEEFNQSMNYRNAA
ncbi:IS3 family transposase [Myroides marinus]|uniref:IS3 family transposase n=1 Tax=Myroides marinus TaxID=703342 RepID=UPI00257700C9|nr:IS3 family transposase [Myroides marinus]